MPSFDIVSEVDDNEIRNATENTQREIATRYDFRGVDASVEYSKPKVNIKAEADFQCVQLLDMFRIQLTKRNVDPNAMEYDDEAVHSGKSFSLSLHP